MLQTKPKYKFPPPRIGQLVRVAVQLSVQVWHANRAVPLVRPAKHFVSSRAEFGLVGWPYAGPAASYALGASQEPSRQLFSTSTCRPHVLFPPIWTSLAAVEAGDEAAKTVQNLYPYRSNPVLYFPYRSLSHSPKF